MPSPVPPAHRARRDAWILGVGAVSAVAALWALARFAGPRTDALPPDLPGGGASAPGAPMPSQEDLVRQNYNLMLQVRANDGEGRPMAVGAVLSRKMEVLLTGANGQPYAQQFDRVGMWAAEIPAGTYTIARDQPGLAKWKWTLSGEGLRPAPGGGWTVTFKSGTMNPMLDLFLH
jgi:hypothetical protein